MESEARRAEYAAGLKAEAERRFGPARAEALKASIESVAGWMADVEEFPLDADEPPAFYAEPAP